MVAGAFAGDFVADFLVEPVVWSGLMLGAVIPAAAYPVWRNWV